MGTELLTVSQTAQYLQLSEKTIRRMIGNGSLPASKLGNHSWRIRSCDVDEYVSNSHQNKPMMMSFLASARKGIFRLSNDIQTMMHV